MSSIDKYVESEARSCNPHVRVVNIGGRIKGYIGTTKVFDIADRYGYLDASESKMIHDGIAAYEESQRLERERRERERAMELERERARLEAERVAAISALRDEVSKVKNELARSYESAKKAYERAVSDVDLSRRLTAIRGFDVSAYGERISALETKMRNAATGIDGEYRSRLEDISGIESGISDSLSTDEAISRTRRLKRIGTEIVGTELPVSDIRRLGEELDKLAETVGRLEAELSRLTAIKGSARVRGMINDAVSYARSSKICSLDDAQRMIEDIRERVRAVVEVAASEAIAENIDEIAVLNGIVSSCEQLREYVVEQNYTATSYRREIVDAASEVIKAYTELREAEYTTCYSERISQVLTMVQEILIGDYTDGATLEQLRAVFDEAAEYKREDSLQADNYADYLNKVAELTDRGYDAALIEDFDPRAYDEQWERLNELLLVQDRRESVSKTRMTFILACETMEKMGYRAIYCNLGKGDDSEDALAAEAIYAIPGCEGVVFRVVAAEYNITRTLVGVKRASGSTTSVEHVMEVARRIEDSGELDEYFSSYAEASGVAISPVGAVDSYTEGSEAVIMENGCFSLGEAEESYDKIVASATEEQRRRWHIERSAGVVATPIREISEGEVTRRERAANSTGAALRAKRYGEVKG